jgi:hypothetical protein
VGIPAADNPAALLEAVEDAGQGRRVQARASRQRRWSERAVGVDDVERVEVDVLELEL